MIALISRTKAIQGCEGKLRRALVRHSAAMRRSHLARRRFLAAGLSVTLSSAAYAKAPQTKAKVSANMKGGEDQAAEPKGEDNLCRYGTPTVIGVNDEESPCLFVPHSTLDRALDALARRQREATGAPRARAEIWSYAQAQSQEIERLRLPRGETWVHLQTDNPSVVLMQERDVRLLGSFRDGVYVQYNYERLCRAPCNRWVTVTKAQSLYLSGPGVAESRRFSLVGHNRVSLRVRAGRKEVWIVGAILAAGGMESARLGALIWSGAFTNDKTLVPALIGAGVATAFVGALLWLVGRTTFDVIDY